MTTCEEAVKKVGKLFSKQPIRQTNATDAKNNLEKKNGTFTTYSATGSSSGNGETRLVKTYLKLLKIMKF